MLIPYPENEEKRLKALKEYKILDSGPEPLFDGLAQLAASICGTPIAAITFIDENRQYIKARVGMDLENTERDESFCTHTILQEETMEVPDTAEDERFKDIPFVTGDLAVRFYAGHRLVTQCGESLGAICVLDTKPRTLTEKQKSELALLAEQAMSLVENRRMNIRLLDALNLSDYLQKELEDANIRFEAFMDHTPSICYMKDEDGRFVYANRRLGEVFGTSREHVVGTFSSDWRPKEMSEQVESDDRHVRETLEASNTLELVRRPDGEELYWATNKFPFRDASGKIMLGAIAIDVSDRISYERSIEEQITELEGRKKELESVNQRLERLSATDGLTGLKNHAEFKRSLTIELARHQSTGDHLTVLLLDVDHFKQYNDNFGHLAGDQVLQQVSMLLVRETRASDVVARYGGEEFAVVLPRTSLETAESVAERIRKAIAEHKFPNRVVTVSMGISIAQPASTIHTLIDFADRGLYMAKESGRNKVCMYQEDKAA
jgi:diguanylate cyclase (GGDEF)-like protein/PAS domain S-box-containing protein